VNRKFQKDIKFSITSIGLNLIFILFNLPVSIAILFGQSDIIFALCYFIFYLSYGINFFILIFFNSIFHDVFFSMICIKFTTTHKIEASVPNTGHKNTNKETF
jgi:hypothetical protein